MSERAGGRELGSASLELVLLTPVLVLLLLLVVLGGRYAQARADVDAAARDSARAGSIARDAEAARVAADTAARARLDEGGVTCRSLVVDLDTTDFRAGGRVVATVTCAVDLSDLTGLAVPSERTFVAEFASPIDAFRRVSE